MAAILFVTWDGGGNVPPAVGIASELTSRGHAVRLIGHHTQRSVIADANLAFVPFEDARRLDSKERNSPLTFLATFGDRAMGHDVIAELGRRPADIVVVDCFLYGATEASSNSATPYVVLQHTFEEYFTHKWLRGPIGFGLRLKRFKTGQLLDAAAVRLVPTLPELDPAATRPLAPNVRHTGPVVSGRPANPQSPKVLVSLSTMHFAGMDRVLQNILDALSIVGVPAIVTTGPALDPASLRPPPTVELHRFVPHATVLPTVSLVVGHGGHATTMAALAHDLPLLVLPMHPMADQAMNGQAVQSAGAGRVLPKKTPPEQIARTITDLLADGPHRQAAARLGRLIREAQGAATAADAIESVIG